ncbi:hypothetical protein HDA32_000526 [Spinactinospora alkalitolerans]|uniref:Uncharacterized protein n=1 Tax=Spinactinospora alkalitolerans TaxID=687207 RepID=A0A852TMA4_9ACTN|nr:hypothetical protein [Spinactinospora alkalitolerans]NYE45406.1 hypothetical protein [Spinactinospora alkalitolerans]
MYFYGCAVSACSVSPWPFPGADPSRGEGGEGMERLEPRTEEEN